MNLTHNIDHWLTGQIINAAIEVHEALGPGLLESIYEWCLIKELSLRGFDIEKQQAISIQYKQFAREEILRFDLLVNHTVLLEIKAIEHVLPVHKAQLLSYMKLLNVPLGLLINFNVKLLSSGVTRLINTTKRSVASC